MSRQIATTRRARPSLSTPRLVRPHGRPDRAGVASVRLRVTGPGDDARALTLRTGVQNLLDAHPAHLALDVSAVVDAGGLFVRTLSDLASSAAGRGCDLSLVGLGAPGLRGAISEAPDDQVARIEHASQPSGDDPGAVTATLPPDVVR